MQSQKKHGKKKNTEPPKNMGREKNTRPKRLFY